MDAGVKNVREKMLERWMKDKFKKRKGKKTIVWL